VAGIDPKYYYLTLGLLATCTIVGLFVAYRLQRDVAVDDAPPIPPKPRKAPMTLAQAAEVAHEPADPDSETEEEPTA
jgi:hypothetical protein